ncbi:MULTISPECIES: hypothetical protein [unclassified Kaistella]|uniref:hypothetical protein n=1 Tax=unclassified Kaistella TaxID=2762626 RepID=UPI0027333EF6|nr:MULTISPECIES: hypothetical protein [unclassified Kaistella]MDP2455101.1 hypothetical protein [Kaistella sp. SH11-4b]MDP2458008.1 hypothetical protein [Kaistella sp. SH40-3]MDP2460848.1 hypothetical protein [Kaistella sp. SH19-2b]
MKVNSELSATNFPDSEGGNSFARSSVEKDHFKNFKLQKRQQSRTTPRYRIATLYRKLEEYL